MRALLQRVSQASVSVDGNELGSIGAGYLILLGVGEGDTPDVAAKLWEKIRKLRIFEDENGKTNLSLMDVGGDVLVVSQFTLYADCKKGNRPSFTRAMEPAGAEAMYELFLDLVRKDVPTVAHGEFGAMMDVSLVNDGPFTIWLDTE